MFSFLTSQTVTRVGLSPQGMPDDLPKAPSNSLEPRIPPELITLVIDALARTSRHRTDSLRGLLQVSLVSKQFCLHRARSHIFRSVELGCYQQADDADGNTVGAEVRRLKGLLDIMVGNEALASYMLYFRVKLTPFIKSQQDLDTFNQVFPGILQRLRSLTMFVLESPNMFQWNKLSGEVHEAVKQCCSLPSLLRLDFQGFWDLPPPLIFSPPSLQKLSLLNISGDPRVQQGEAPIPVAWTGRLKVLNSQNAATIIAPCTLASLPSFAALEGLGLSVSNNSDIQTLRRFITVCRDTLQFLNVLLIPHTGWTLDDIDLSFLPQLSRFGLFVCPGEQQPTLQCPGFIPTLINDCLRTQGNLQMLSLFITFRTSSLPSGELTGFLENQESWGRLDEHLTSGAARRLQTVNLVIVITVDGDGLDAEDPEDRFEDLESHLMNEVRSSFPKSVEKDRITIEIDVRRHPRAQGSIV